jgi:stearoyl-CoA desaturase (delta-9 desaturase)
MFSKRDWLNCSFLLVVHVMSVVGIALYASVLPWSWKTFALSWLWFACCGVSITGGYHRLFAHRSYRAHGGLKLFYLLFGAAGFQSSALNWSTDHRHHHGQTDTPEDPYTVKGGFWWAHIGWLLTHREKPRNFSNVGDLAADPLIMFQHRHCEMLGLLVGLLLPMAIASIWGDALGGLFFAGFVRLLVQYHATFSVNSVAHTIGTQPYSDANSSRDSVITAIITLGEGYHNFHHTFPGDYRNGVRAYQFDPTKWLVYALSWARITWDLRRVPRETILKAMLDMDLRSRLEWLRATHFSPIWEQRLQMARDQLEILLETWTECGRRYTEARARLGSHAQAELKHLKAEVQMAKRRFKRAYRQWRAALVQPELLGA